MKQALQWCDFLERHARKIYAPELNSELAAAHALLVKIKAGNIEDGTRIRDIYRREWSGLTDAEIVGAGLSVLDQHNIAKVEREETAGRTAEIIRINPELSRRAA